MTKVCNGVPDCPRGDDELVCGEFSQVKEKRGESGSVDHCEEDFYEEIKVYNYSHHCVRCFVSFNLSCGE